MAEFTPINTQEELDGIIASRLKRERKPSGNSIRRNSKNATRRSPDSRRR